MAEQIQNKVIPTLILLILITGEAKTPFKLPSKATLLCFAGNKKTLTELGSVQYILLVFSNVRASVRLRNASRSVPL